MLCHRVRDFVTVCYLIFFALNPNSLLQAKKIYRRKKLKSNESLSKTHQTHDSGHIVYDIDKDQKTQFLHSLPESLAKCCQFLPPLDTNAFPSSPSTPNNVTQNELDTALIQCVASHAAITHHKNTATPPESNIENLKFKSADSPRMKITLLTRATPPVFGYAGFSWFLQAAYAQHRGYSWVGLGIQGNISEQRLGLGYGLKTFDIFACGAEAEAEAEADAETEAEVTHKSIKTQVHEDTPPHSLHHHNHFLIARIIASIAS